MSTVFSSTRHQSRLCVGNGKDFCNILHADILCVIASVHDLTGNLFGGSTDTQSMLTSLNVAKCSLTDDIITSLANNVPGSLPNLSELDLTGNTAITALALGTLSTLLNAGKQIKMKSCILSYNYVSHH